MKFRLSLIGAFLAVATWGAAATAAYPERAIQLVVPYSPGGAADHLARRTAEIMAKDLGQPVVVMNRAGGNTFIGSQLVAKGPADGYQVLLVTNTNIVLNPLLYKKVPYDAQRDLKVIGQIVETPLVIVANPSLPVSNLNELAKYAKANPGKLNYSSTSLGSPLTLAVERLKDALNIDIMAIPYPGAAPAMTAVIAGDVELAIDAASTAVPMVNSGRVKALAVTSPSRLQMLPNVPAVSEVIPGYQASVWYGLAVQSATPEDIVRKLQAALYKAVLDPQLRTAFAEKGFLVQPQRTQAQIDAYVQADRERWTQIVKDKNIKLD
jgi:tripartite-type tricarboxylate transporter receptor subunit TctC